MTQLLLTLVTQHLFGAELARTFAGPPTWLRWRELILSALALLASARNVKRPARITLAVEWLYLASLLYGGGAFIVFLFEQIRGRSVQEFVTFFSNLPWTDAEKMIEAQRVTWWKPVFALLPLQAVLAFVYGWRVRAAISVRTEENSDAAQRA